MTAVTILPSSASENRPQLDERPGYLTVVVFLTALAGGLAFAAYSLTRDVVQSGVQTTTYLPFVLLGISLLIALGFEFVNGFHDTANAVATVIYTHSLTPNFAVMWSGAFSFLGVLVSSGWSFCSAAIASTASNSPASPVTLASGQVEQISCSSRIGLKK
nr:inorganic phosphate transporter [Steroidobacter cummioxidans]